MYEYITLSIDKARKGLLELYSNEVLQKIK